MPEQHSRLVPEANTLDAASRLYALGNGALDRGDLRAAEEYLERSLHLRATLAPGSRDYALSLISLGNLARRRGEISREEQYLQQALQVGDALTPIDRADIYDGLGSACDQRPCSQQPEDYFSLALQLREQVQSESLGVASTLSFMGRSAANEGDLDQAEEDFNKALELRRRLAPGSLAIAASLTDLGVVARARGNLAAAEICFRAGLRIRRDLAPHSLAVADSLHNLGILLWLRDDLSGAREYLEQALRLRRKLIPGAPALAQSLIWEGLLCVRTGRLDEAHTYFTRGLELLEKTLSPDSLAVSAVLNSLGSLARTRGDLALSQAYYRRALAIEMKDAPDSPAAANSIQALAGLLRQQGKLPEAESYYRRALAIQERKIPNNSAHTGTLFGLASLLRQEHKRDEAQQMYVRAADTLERQTGSLGGTPDERSVFRARFEDNYKDYVDFLVALGYPDLALGAAERARAWALLESLERARVSLPGSGDSRLERIRHSLQEQIGAAASYRIRLLDGGYGAAQLTALDQRLAELEERYRDAEEEIELHNPAYTFLTHPRTLTGAQVQALLDDDTLLLEYSLGPGASYVWALTRTSLTLHRLPPRRVIEQAASRVRELMTARAVRPAETDAQRSKRLRLADAQYPAAARDLSRLVLGPVAELLTKKRIVVVPDGALQYIPVAALPSPQAGPSVDSLQGKSASADEPLVIQHELTSLPSASVLAELRRQALGREPPPKAVAVLADPVFDSRDERIQSQSAVLLDRLPWTRLEAAQIMKVTPTGAGLQALDFEASRATALSPALAQYRIVHFATHAISDGEHPERSGLVLSLFDRHGQPQNGFLGLEQIYGLNLPADLVVLSACDTALGREVRGEGLVGLVRGFMYAGATRVMASLWNVDDEVTARLMAHFYQSLEQDGLSAAAALRAAQIEVRQERQWSAPYYWAAFQLEGEWR
jgi:CHAT domain-containing protein/Tfp pilus assembly protein PilF